MTYNQQAAIRSLKGSQNRTEGLAFEKLIENASIIYADLDFFGGIEGDGGDIVKIKYTGRVWSR